MSAPIRVLILGTGGMAKRHAETFAEMPGVALAAGVDTNPGRLADFNARQRIERGFTSLDEAIAWGEFDTASNVTPDAVHYPTTMALLRAGKHVLCEKPLATTAEHAEEMARAAEAAGVVNMVNLSYREVPAVIQAHAMVEAGEIGEIRHFEASYLQSWLTQDSWGAWDKEEKWLWRLSTAHGSHGVLGDVGVHIVDYATYIAGAGVRDISCRLTTFDKAPGGQIGEYVLDANDSFSMNVRLDNGAAGVIHASRFASGHINDLVLRIFGTRGGLEVRYENKVSRLRACMGDENMRNGRWEDIASPDVPSNFARFIAAVRAGQQVLPDFARGAALQRVLDRATESDAAGGGRLAI